MKKAVKLNVEETLARLNFWLDKVEPCYYEEVKKSMEKFKRECGLMKA